jgi:hypothetical protein
MEGQAFSILSPHQAFYIQAMLFNTTSAFQSCSIAETIIKRIADGELDPQEKKDVLLDCLQNVVNQSGAISRYFFPSRDGAKSTGKNSLHKDRGRYLSKVFGVKDDSPLTNRALRNSLEHFDERLDIYLQNGIFGYIFPSLVLSEPEGSDVPHHIFRAYYVRDGIFQVLGERFKIQPIVDEVTRIHHLLLKFDRNGGVFCS